METTHEQLTEGNGGWVRYQSNALSAPVFARLEDRAGRLVLVDLFLPAVDGTIDTTLLRAIPTGRIEAWANMPRVAESIRAALNLPAPDLRRAVSYFATSFGRRARRTWVTRMLAAQVDGSDEPQVEMLELAPRLIDPLFDLASVNARLAVPKGRNYGDDFYKQVASIYARLASKVRNPVATIAEANGVPLSTVQRWVREARRRGFLPGALPGKRG